VHAFTDVKRRLPSGAFLVSDCLLQFDCFAQFNLACLLSMTMISGWVHDGRRRQHCPFVAIESCRSHRSLLAAELGPCRALRCWLQVRNLQPVFKYTADAAFAHGLPLIAETSKAISRHTCSPWCSWTITVVPTATSPHRGASPRVHSVVHHKTRVYRGSPWFIAVVKWVSRVELS